MTTLIEEAAGAWVAPMSGSELGAKFGRSPRWGRQAVQLARRRAADQPAAAGLPVAPVEVPPAAVELPLVARPAEVAEQRVLPALPAADQPTAVAEVVRTAPASPAPSGRVAATLAFVLGVAATIAGNIAHAVLIPHAGAGAFLAAGAWPVMLLAAVEVLARVRPPRGAVWKLTRFGGTLTVAAVAAVVSYGHLHALLLAYGEGPLSAAIGPLAPDALAVVAAVSLLGISRRERQGGGSR